MGCDHCTCGDAHGLIPIGPIYAHSTEDVMRRLSIRQADLDKDDD